MHLIELPNVLLELIVRSCRLPTDLETHFIDCEYNEYTGTYLMYQDLNSLSQTCKRLNRITIPVLYQIICVTNDGAIRDLENTLHIKPELARYSRTVIVDYCNTIGYKMKVGFVANLPHVEHIFIRSIGSKEDQDIYWVEIWEKVVKSPCQGVVAPLSSLGSCNLIFRDDDWLEWHTFEVWEIFLHPTLECITVGHTTTYQSSIEQKILATGRPHLHSTMLQELHFVASDVTPDDLQFILQCPKGLKALSIYNYERCDDNEMFSPEQYVAGIREIAPTLQYLRFHENARCTEGPSIGLASFYSLRVLDINIGFLFGRINPVSDVPFAGILPPNLEILRINALQHRYYSSTTDDYGHEHLLELAKNLSTFAPNLRMLIFRDRRVGGYNSVWTDWKECDWAFRDQGVVVEDDNCSDFEEYCKHHHGNALLSRWRHYQY